MDNEERAQLEAHYQNEIESIKGEVARLTDLLEQVLSSKNEKGIFAQPLGSCFLLLSPSTPAVGSKATCKAKKTQQAMVFISFSPSKICSRPSFFPLVLCSFLLQMADLAAEEGVLEAGGRSCGCSHAWGRS